MENLIAKALQQGTEMQLAGEFDIASQLYNKVVTLQPDHADANYKMGLLKVAMGDDLEALPYLQTALEADKSIAKFWLSYGRVLIKLELFDDAIRILKLARESGHEGKEFVELNRLINSLVGSETIIETDADKLEQAESNIIDAESLDYALTLAKKYVDKGNSEKATQIYEDILDKLPQKKHAEQSRASLNILATPSNKSYPSPNKISNLEKLLVYTTAIGWNYDLPAVNEISNVDYICLTDQEISSSNGWTCRPIKPLFNGDLFRSSREPKTKPNELFPDYERSLFIDSTVCLKVDPNDLWNYLIPNNQVIFGAIYHSFRESVKDEFSLVASAGLDHVSTVQEQFDDYKKFNLDILLSKPVWGGILARRHNHPDCINAMHTWFSHILRYSRRDQLSLPIALQTLPPDSLNVVTLDLYNSQFHSWPHNYSNKPPYQTVAREVQANSSSGNTTKVKEPEPKAQNIEFGQDPQSKLFFAHNPISGQKVYLSDKKRQYLYKSGIEHRQKWLLRDYSLPENLIRNGDCVVDVGANVGELGIWAEALGAKYIAFEPDPKAYLALQKNVKGVVFDIALSDENGTAEFYLNSAEADSSLFKPETMTDKINVKKFRLDDFWAETEKPKRIRLLKIEAEGTEPEVLKGAVETIKLAEYVAVDAGPERGGKHVISVVLNFLYGSGFEVIDCFMPRGTFLLRKHY